MPSPWHDGVTNSFRADPAMAADLLRAYTDVDLPPGLHASLAPPGFNDRPSTDFFADKVAIEGPAHDPVHGSILEAQKEPLVEKLQQMARYAAALWLLLRKPVHVLVICPNEDTASFYAQPAETSLAGYRFRARSLSVTRLPVITDPEYIAAHPGISTLAVSAHGDVPGVADAFVAAIKAGDDPKKLPYYEHAFGMASNAIREILEDIVATTWPVNSPFAKEHFGRGKTEGRVEGKAEGKAEEAAEAVLLVLKARKLRVSGKQSALITGCTDLAQLQTWVSRAATVKKTSDLFRDPAGRRKSS